MKITKLVLLVLCGCMVGCFFCGCSKSTKSVTVDWKYRSERQKRKWKSDYKYTFMVNSNEVGDYTALEMYLSQFSKDTTIYLLPVRGLSNPYPADIMNLAKFCDKKGITLIESIAVKLDWSVCPRTGEILYSIDTKLVGNFSALEIYVSRMPKYSHLIQVPYTEGDHARLFDLCKKYGVTYSFPLGG